MKTYYKTKQLILNISILLIFVFSCKAQSPIIDIDDRDQELVDGSYLKDVHNELDKFVGTWLYSNGNTTLIITLEKRAQIYNDSWYEDLLVGEYKYVENGIEKINTLSNFQNQAYVQNPFEHNLVGSLIIYKYEFPGCSNCTTTEKRVKINVSDPTPNVQYMRHAMYMGLRHINGLTPSIQIDFALGGSMSKPDGAPSEPTLPLGRYVLQKQ